MGAISTAPRFVQANLFELSEQRLHVTFSSTSFAGDPQLEYRDGRTRRSFRGDEIAMRDTALGLEVTVVLETIPDLRTVSFTLVLPAVHVLPGSMGSRLRSPGIITTAHTTIAGPPLGPDKTYETFDLSGTAQHVVF
ncbi:MAG: hypothetical protein IT372_06425 [Polyangiaceae bacterium]|nr:hypothetical protein [Polyangiaceae bacterium]